MFGPHLDQAGLVSAKVRSSVRGVLKEMIDEIKRIGYTSTEFTRTCFSERIILVQLEAEK